jgi:HPt (histidine-containing phosphotransfer) domain-containing protein
MRLALEQSDFAAIRDLGHKLSGTGAGYGFPRISEIGAALEAAARSSDTSAIRMQLDALAAICGPDI